MIDLGAMPYLKNLYTQRALGNWVSAGEMAHYERRLFDDVDDGDDLYSIYEGREWWAEDMLPEAPVSRHGCTCFGYEGYGCIGKDAEGKNLWRTHPDCRYHQAAAAQPWNHRIPWNCPTYFDGCNCEGGPYFR